MHLALTEEGNGWLMENWFYSRHTLTDSEYEVFFIHQKFSFLF